MVDRSDKDADRQPSPHKPGTLTTIAIVAYGLLLAGRFAFFPAEQQVEFDNYYLEIVLLGIVTLLLARRTYLASEFNNRLFWGIILLGFSAWWCVSILALATARLPVDNMLLFKDILLMLNAAAIAVAIEIRADAYDDQFWLQDRILYAIGGFMLVFASFAYFAILPTLTGVSLYQSPYVLYAAIDFYLAVRFFVAASHARNRSWRRIYAYFSLVFVLIVAADALSFVYRHEYADYAPENPVNLVWYLWYPVAFLAAGLTQISPEQRPGETDAHFLTPATSGLLVFGLAMPLTHVAGYGFGLFDPMVHKARDIFVAAWIVVITGILYSIYLLVLARVGKLSQDRAEAKQKADKIEHQLETELRIRSLGRLSAGLAHDFGNTVTAIAMNAKAIENRIKRGESLDRELNGIQQAIRYAQDLVTKLSLFGGSRGSALTDTFDMNVEIGNTIELVLPSITDGVSLRYFPAATPVMITAERSMVHQVVTNYIYNAIDAIGKRGRVDVTTEVAEIDLRCASCGESVSGRFAVLSVTDDGPGIYESVKDSVFEPLVTTKPVGKGSGLGLSTVHGITHKLGGHVGLTTGPGTTFLAYFPLSRPRSPN